MDGNNVKGFYKKPLASKPKSVGGQGIGGGLAGASVPGVSNPQGLEPKSHGSVKLPLAQGPVEPKVGK
jgi:hypothetical protein